MTAIAPIDTVSIDNLPLLSGALSVSGSVSIDNVVQVTGSVQVTGVSLSASFPSSMTVEQGAGNVLDPWYVSGSVTVGNVVQVTGSVTVAGVTLSGSLAPPASTGHTTQNLTASITSQLALAANPVRLGLSFFNTFGSRGNAYISLGAVASTGSFVAALKPGSYFSFDALTTEAISIIFDGAPGNIMVTEQT